jgi:hypothetical protein
MGSIDKKEIDLALERAVVERGSVVEQSDNAVRSRFSSKKILLVLSHKSIIDDRSRQRYLSVGWQVKRVYNRVRCIGSEVQGGAAAQSANFKYVFWL